MKYFAVLAVAIVVCVNANPHIVNTGSSAVSRQDDGHGNYAFSYKENHASGGTFRQEKGGHGGVVGSYGLTDHDGRHRVVNYVADAHGFRADVKTNEPGVDPKQDPAAVSINGGHYAISEPVKIISGPALGYANAEYGSAYGGHGYGYGHGYAAGPSAYGVHINHASYAEPAKVIAVGYGGYGGYGHGKW
ncbi:cuticle protein 14-like [Oppia nitens]|uniref:cuticle protein 14-like n=1 Tax=Oppia nitens TaxID=1686743 RepID=UPI0023D9A9C5|nr:cuticle protein 14-like [Oppia nitens]